MNFFYFFTDTKSLSHKILTAILLISSLVTLFITTAQLSFDYAQEMSSLEKTLLLIEKSYTKSLTSSLWQLSEQQMKTSLDGIVSIPGVQYAEILDANNTRVITSYGSLGDAKTIQKTFPLVHRDGFKKEKYIGNLRVYGNVDQVIDKIYKKILVLFITQFIKTLLVSFLIYLCIQQMVTKHLASVSKYLKNINFSSVEKEKRLELDRKKHEPKSEDEIDVLVHSINDMQKEIHQAYIDLNTLNKDLEEKVEEKTRLILVQHQKLEYAAKMSTLGEMAGGIAHEINNPIAIISSASRIMRKHTEKGTIDKDKVLKTCADIDKTVDRISKIILGLRTVSRDASEEEYLPCKVSDVFEDVLGLCSEKFKSHGVEIKIDLQDEVYQTIIPGRRVQLSQVFLNLIGNAYDAIEGLEEKWVKIEARIIDDKLNIRIIDSGNGIPLEVQKKMLQPFFTTKAIGKGTGLGLSLSQSIITQHRGDMDIDNECQNTCFVINLPLYEVQYAKAQ